MSEGGVVDVGGLLIYRHSTHSGYEPPTGEWSLVERRDYGDSVISIYGSNEETDGTGRS